MKLWKPLACSLLCLLSLSAVHAQDIIALNNGDIDRLGIVLSPVRAIDDSIGASFPATVINSPMSTSMLNVPYGGLLESWLVEPGQVVFAQQEVALIRSQELLDLQNDWNAARFAEEQLAFELDKDSMLLDEGIISTQRFRQTQRSYQEAQSNLQFYTARLALAGFTEESLATLREGRHEPGVYSLRSPVAGTMDHLMVDVGTYVESNNPIASIGSNVRWLSAELPARVGNRLSVGQVLRVEGSNAALTLRQKDYEIDTQSQTVGILATFNEIPQFMAGQVVTLLIPPNEDGVLIPGDAVVHSGDETSVFVRTAEGFEVRSLSLSPAGADYMAMEGIAPGELIAIRGTAILKGIQLGLGGE